MARNKIRNVERPLESVREINQRRKDTKAGIVLLLIWVITGIVLFVFDVKADTQIDVLNSYVEYVHRNMKPKYTEKAKRNIPYILESARKYKLDSLLIACISFWEASLKSQHKGRRGEIGLMQVMPAKWTARFDLSTPQGQYDAGTYRLKLAFDKCKTLRRSLTHYACGSCTSESELTKNRMNYRVNYYRQMTKRFK